MTRTHSTITEADVDAAAYRTAELLRQLTDWLNRAPETTAPRCPRCGDYLGVTSGKCRTCHYLARKENR